MFYKYITALLATISLALHAKPAQKCPYPAFVCVPVADLVGEPTQGDYQEVVRTYRSLPLCGGKQNPFVACPRMHQLLFNELVTVVKEVGDEVMVEVSNAFYITRHDRHTHHTTFWTLKKNIVPYKLLQQKNLDTRNIPPAISFSRTKKVSNASVITLCLPFHDQTTGRTFSAGTRFVYTPKSPSNDQYYASIFDPQKNIFTTTALPKNICVDLHTASPQERIKCFVSIVRMWANTNQGTIPYVWGGSSFTTTTNQPFIELPITVDNITTSYYEIPGYTSAPKTGLDCSGLVMRAAQIAGIPYFYKNTSTIEKYVPALHKGDTVSEGDLILIDRHVMVVANIANNTLIEARSYPHGFGKVQEIPLNKVFRGINTYDDLYSAYMNKTRVYRMDSEGVIKDDFPVVTLKKMARLLDHA